MTARQETGARPGLDVLRRRSYRADATAADLRRYLDEQRAALPAPPAATPPARSAARPRHRAAAGLGLLLAAAVAIALAGRLAQPPTEPPAAAAMRQDIGEGRLLTVDTRAVAGPTPVASEIDGTAAVGQRFTGYGNAVVRFEPPPGAFDGGRAAIAVTSTAVTGIAWRALIVVSGQDRRSYRVVAARGSAEERSGAHAPTVFVYPSRPPTRVAVEAPAGVGWTLVVAVTDRISPELR